MPQVDVISEAQVHRGWPVPSEQRQVALVLLLTSLGFSFHLDFGPIIPYYLLNVLMRYFRIFCPEILVVSKLIQIT